MVAALVLVGAVSASAKRVNGDAQANALRGTARADVMSGGRGDDRLRGRGGDDRLFGGPGNDVLYGDAGKDKLAGGPGDDVLVGGAGVDLLLGGPGDDVLRGGPGKDFISCGAGRDTVVGADASDVINGGCESSDAPASTPTPATPSPAPVTPNPTTPTPAPTGTFNLLCILGIGPRTENPYCPEYAPKPPEQNNTNYHPRPPAKNYTGTMHLKFHWIDTCGHDYGEFSQDYPAEVSIGAPWTSDTFLEYTVGEEYNPVHLYTRIAEGWTAGNYLDLTSATHTAGVSPALTKQHWALQLSGTALTGSLIDQGTNEALAGNLLFGQKELIDCNLNIINPWVMAVKKGATVAGTVTDDQVTLTFAGNTIDNLRPFTASITAARKN